VANLGQSIMQVMQAMMQVLNQLDQLKRMKEQIDNQVRELDTLYVSSWAELTTLLVEQLNELNQLLGKLTIIKYRSETIQNEFDSLFPKDAEWKTVSGAAYGSYVSRWHDELLNAALTSMDSQSHLTRLLKRNGQIASLLAQSEGADGVVRQLQVVNELLALTAGHITDLASALITTSRMTSTATAMQASQERMAREAASRARKNYTYKGKAPRRLKELPKFY